MQRQQQTPNSGTEAITLTLFERLNSLVPIQPQDRAPLCSFYTYNLRWAFVDAQIRDSRLLLGDTSNSLMRYVLCARATLVGIGGRS